MGLVDYSDSDSGSETEATPKPVAKPAPSTAKKPFQKVVDRSNPGRIVVNLPQLSADSKTPASDEPPAKRAKTAGGGLFSGFNSFLPAPKNANKPKPATSSSGPPRPGVNLKTSAAPGFSRGGDDDGSGDSSLPGAGMGLPAPKAAAQPTIPEGQTKAEDVKLVGKPLMFKPLSVARNTNKKKKNVGGIPKAPTPAAKQPGAPSAKIEQDAPKPAPAPKVSLFSMHTEEASELTEPSNQGGSYEPMFASHTNAASHDSVADDYASYASYAQSGPSVSTVPGSESLDTIADDMNLTAAQRRELFGRGGAGQSAKRVINFNMDKEYQHNEEVRAAGEQQVHNPVKAISGGKHSLRQLVQNVQNQKDALEDSFAKGKTNRKEASNKYGW